MTIYERSHPSSPGVGDKVLGQALGAGKEWNVSVFDGTTTTSLFKVTDSGDVTIKHALTVGALALGVVHASVAGLLSSSPVLLSELDPSGATSGQIAAYSGSAWAPFTLTIAGLGGVPTSRNLTAGNGLSGGGDLSADRTFAVNVDTTSLVIAADTLSVGVISDAQHGNRGGGSLHALAVSAGAAGFMSGTDKAILDALNLHAVHDSLVIHTAAPLGGGGALTGDLFLTVASATTGAVGVLQLAGDLAGTGTAAAAPTVSSLTGASGAVAVHGASLTWDIGTAASGGVGVVITQAARNFAGSTAASLHISAQNNTGSASTGGSVFIDAGTGIGNASGVVMLRADSTLAGGGVGVFAIGSNALTMLNTNRLTLSDGAANPVAVLTPIYNGQTELTFAATLSRFDIDFDPALVQDGQAASIHITAQANTGSSSSQGGSIFMNVLGGPVMGAVELQVGSSTLLKLDGAGVRVTGPVAFFGGTPVAKPAAYVIAHHLALRNIDEGSVSTGDLARFVCTFMMDMGAAGGGGYNLFQ